jgi:hypothetical protein
MEDIQTWKELLKKIIENVQERQRIAHEAHVNPLTLSRWANGESQPRQDNLRALLKAISPQFSQQFTRLLAIDFPEFAQVVRLHSHLEPDLTSEFYTRVLGAYAHTTPALFQQAICDLVVQQALEHLDPNREGMAISIVSCVHAAPGATVRSLRMIGGIGTPPWKRNLDQDVMFLGVESLAGAAVSKCRLVHVPNRSDPFLPAHWLDYEQSAVAAPILRKTQIAGCLVFSSSRENYFTPHHILLIEHYTHLVALAFDPEQFFHAKDIQLQLMPQYHVQTLLFQNFNQRVTQKFAEAAHNNKFITIPQVQEMVWQEIEAELLQLSARGE